MPDNASFTVKTLHQLVREVDALSDTQCSSVSKKSIITLANALCSVVENIEKDDLEASETIRLMIKEALSDLRNEKKSPAYIGFAITLVLGLSSAIWKATVLTINKENEGKYIEASTWESYLKDIESARAFRLGDKARIESELERLKDINKELKNSLSNSREKNVEYMTNTDAFKERSWREMGVLQDKLKEISESLEEFGKELKQIRYEKN